MSRYIDIDENGDVAEEIASLEQCRHLINDVCCNEDSPCLKNCPTETECEDCPYYLEEDGYV